MRIRIIAVIFFVISGLHAQESLDFYEVDSLSYIHYQNKEYAKLKTLGNDAIREGIDFFYLRLRLGIVYYERRNYEKALIHFRRAYEMNPADTLNAEYYYYALINTLREAEALDLLKNLSAPLKSKLTYQPKQIEDLASSFSKIAVSGGAILTDNITSNEDRNFAEGGLTAEVNLQGNTYVLNAYLENRFTNRLSLFNGFSFFQINSMGLVNTLETSTKRSYSNDNYQYNVGFGYLFKKDWRLGASFGYYKENWTLLYSEFSGPGQPTSYVDSAFANDAYSGSLRVDKRFREFNLGLELSTGNFAGLTQYQAGIELFWYPFGNTTFYSQTAYYFLQNDDQEQHIVSQYFGGLFSSRIGYKVGGSFGNHHNFLRSSGLYSYNTMDPIYLNGEIALDFRLTDHLSLCPSYTLQERELTYSVVSDFINQSTQTHSERYFNHSLICTLLWKF